MKGTVVDIIAGANFTVYLELQTEYSHNVVVKHSKGKAVGRGDVYPYDSEQVVATGAKGGLVIDSCKRQVEQMRKIKITE